jgi:hypothetical protein
MSTSITALYDAESDTFTVQYDGTDVAKNCPIKRALQITDLLAKCAAGDTNAGVELERLGVEPPLIPLDGGEITDREAFTTRQVSSLRALRRSGWRIRVFARDEPARALCVDGIDNEHDGFRSRLLPTGALEAEPADVDELSAWRDRETVRVAVDWHVRDDPAERYDVEAL